MSALGHYRNVDDSDLTNFVIARLRDTGRFGFIDADLDDPIFRGSFPYTFRSAVIQASIEDRLISLVRSAEPSNADRLWAYSFVEDVPDAVSLLKRSDQAYRSFLAQCIKTDLPFFLQKMARFQLVLVANDGFDAGVRYVEWVRRLERDAVADMQAHLTSPAESPVDFLMRRLHSARLSNALPITVYRLGIFGDSTTIAELYALREQHHHVDLDHLVDEAIQRISLRMAPVPDDGSSPDPDKRSSQATSSWNPS